LDFFDDYYEPNNITTMNLLLRRTPVHSYRLSSHATFTTIINLASLHAPTPGRSQLKYH